MRDQLALAMTFIILGQTLIPIFMILLPFVSDVKAQNPAYTIKSRFATITPLIDGKLGENEWIDASVFHVNGTGHWPRGIEVYVYIKNDANNLFIAFDSITDITGGSEDQASIEFYKGQGKLLSTYFRFYHSSDYGFFNISRSDGGDVGFPVDLPQLQPIIVRGFSNSTNNNVPQRIYEFRIPLENSGIWGIGQRGNTVGISFIVDDASTPGLNGSTNWPGLGGPYRENEFGSLILAGSLSVKIFANPKNLKPAENSTVIVHVTDADYPVQEARVTLLSNEACALFSQQAGDTDSNGNFSCTFTSPSVSVQTIITISVNATKNGYLSGHNQTQISVNVTSEIDFKTIAACILAGVVIIALTMTLVKKRKKSP